MQKIRNLLLFIILVTGFVIVALPDSGPRLFSISTNHGPSLQDVIGLLLIQVSYIFIVAMAWKKREKLRIYQNSSIVKLGLFLFGLGFGLVIASVCNDYQYWWIYGALIMLIVQIPIFYVTLK